MLETIRNRLQGIVTWLIVIVIGVAFAAWGTDFFSSSGGGQNVAAKVNGQKISWMTVDTMYERLSKQFNEKVDEKDLKEQLRMALVQRLALLASAEKLGYRVGEEALMQALLQIPAFQKDGKFSKDQYLAVLSKAGYTDASFRQELSQDLLLSQLDQGINFSSFSLPSEVAQLVSLFDQKRDFNYVVIPVQKFKDEIKISDEELKNYFELHQNSYVSPDRAAIEYVQLSLLDLAKKQAVTEQEMLQFYEDNQTGFALPERVHARHILIPIPKTEDPKIGENEANTTALNILNKIRSGEDFGTLARAHSADPGSAKEGGDLGWFTKGQMVPEFDKIVFELKNPGDISSPIKTQFGYHLIQLMERKPPEVRSFGEVRNIVKEEIQRQKALPLYQEQAEQLAKLAFEQPDSLKPITETLDLKLYTSEPFTRQGGLGITENPDIIKATFSDEVLKNKHNSELLKVDENTLVVLRVKEHLPAEQLALEKVEKDVRARLMTEQAAIKAREFGNTLVEKLNAGDNTEGLLKAQQLEWTTKKGISRQTKDLDRSIVAVAFEAERPQLDKPAVIARPLPNGDFLVLALKSVQAGNMDSLDKNTKTAYNQKLAESFGQLEYALYASRVLNNAKIELMDYPK